MHWNDQPLTSVYKGKGAESDLDFYRAIQVQCALAKLYHKILLARLDRFATSERLRAAGQAGFVGGRNAADHLFVLRHLIDRARLAPVAPGRQPRPRLFAAFIDLKKAYDSVPRDMLVRLLAAVGIDGDMLHTICGMYWGVCARPKQGPALGEPFASTCGVRQGDPLSPLLFGLFIDRIEAWLDRDAPSEGVPLPGLGRPLRVLLYADDMVLLSDSAVGLQTLLNALHAFCEASHLEVNVPKSEIVVFGASKWQPPPRPQAGPRPGIMPGPTSPCPTLSNTLALTSTAPGASAPPLTVCGPPACERSGACTAVAHDLA